MPSVDEPRIVRDSLPPMPENIERLPVRRGYPVPWFVQWFDDDGNPTDRGTGTPEFRVVDSRALAEAHAFGLCWVCGRKKGRWSAFVAGPMCAVNRTSAEPPSHVECAEWSVLACPFLTRPAMRRREAGLPDGIEDPPGNFIERNPGVSMVWVTKRYRPRRAPGGVLFDIGEPERVKWYAEGREATPDEVEASIESGLPALLEMAEKQGPTATAALERMVADVRRMVHG